MLKYENHSLTLNDAATRLSINWFPLFMCATEAGKPKLKYYAIPCNSNGRNLNPSQYESRKTVIDNTQCTHFSCGGTVRNRNSDCRRSVGRRPQQSALEPDVVQTHVCELRCDNSSREDDDKRNRTLGVHVLLKFVTIYWHLRSSS
jgi:hypothetical protein